MSHISDYWKDGDIAVIVSPDIIEELVEVVQRPRLRQQMIADPQIFIDLLSTEATHIQNETGDQVVFSEGESGLYRSFLSHTIR